MHQVQWPGAAVGWDGRGDAMYVSVAVALDSPDVAGWLNVKLTQGLRSALGRSDLMADFERAEGTSGAPMYHLLIRELTGELPDAAQLHAAVERLITEGEQLAARNEGLASTYQETIRRSS